MKVAFRTDASTLIGSGHVTRCVTLATALRDRGAELLFVCREADGDMKAWLEQQGLAVGWLTSDTEDDATETRAALDARGFGAADWLVVDHYGLNFRWEQAMRPSCSRILAIDDLADRAHDCDLLLDQNLVAEYATRYAAWIPVAAVPLLGPRYALLQPGYARAHLTVPARRGRPHRVLAYFGAADLPGLTDRVVGALLRLSSDVAVDMVIGAVNPRRERLLALAQMNSQVTAHLQMPSLVHLMAQAGLAVGASGATSWERLCLGLPALIVTLADNQRAIAAELDGRGLAVWLGDVDELEDDSLERTLGQLLDRDVETWFDARQAGVVDGRGVDRVVAAILGETPATLLSRPVTAADEWLLLDWANDPTTRATAFQPEKILPEGHHRWLHRRLADPGNCRIFIVQTATGVEVGQVRFEREGERWTISYSLAREFRGRGLAARALASALAAVRHEFGPVIVAGRVKPENVASCRVFERLQFTATDVGDSAVEFLRQL